MNTRYKPAPNFDFVSKRRLFGMISAVMVLGSLLLTIFPGPNYGIDFVGGSNIIAQFSEPMGDEEIRQAMVNVGFQDASVVKFGDASNEYVIQTRAASAITAEQQESIKGAISASLGASSSAVFDESSADRFTVRVGHDVYGVDENADEIDGSLFSAKTTEIAERINVALADAGIEGASAEAWGNPADRRFVVRVAGIQSLVTEALTQDFGAKFVSISRIETVGPRVGEQLRDDAVKAILISMLLILLYIAFRFDLRYAPGAVVALFHDVMIVLGIFVIFRIEFDITIVAALLTVIGYSLNDTIVNFDRIRENIQSGALERGESLDQLVNRSVNECLSRTLITGGTTLVALAAIVFLGGPETRNFAFALALGVGVGIYSSLYISNPLMIWMSGEMDKRMPPSETTKRDRDELVV